MINIYYHIPFISLLNGSIKQVGFQRMFVSLLPQSLCGAVSELSGLLDRERPLKFLVAKSTISIVLSIREGNLTELSSSRFDLVSIDRSRWYCSTK